MTTKTLDIIVIFIVVTVVVSSLILFCALPGWEKNERIEQVNAATVIQDNYVISNKTYTVTEGGNIYLIQCPEGKYFADTHGSFSFYKGTGSGSISTSLGEDYIVKYMVGNELKDCKMPVSSSKVLVDGKFGVEKIVTKYATTIVSCPDIALFFDKNNWYYNGGTRGANQFHFDEESQKYVSSWYCYTIESYVIHLPYLPNTDKIR